MAQSGPIRTLTTGMSQGFKLQMRGFSLAKFTPNPSFFCSNVYLQDFQGVPPPRASDVEVLMLFIVSLIFCLQDLYKNTSRARNIKGRDPFPIFSYSYESYHLLS